MKSFYWLTSFSTILGVSISNLVQFWGTASFWLKFSLLMACLATGILAVVDLGSWIKNRPKRYKSAEDVSKYMLRLFKRGSGISVYANSFAWLASSRDLRQFLVNAAQRGSQICLFCPRHNDITKSLSNSGVRVITYESIQHEPEARFTLLNPNEPGSCLLAIGRGSFPNFYIEEFSDETHSRVLSVVRDLLHIIENINKS